MTQIFINGGGPDYLGFNFTNSTSLLTELHTQLVAAGATSVVNTPLENLIEVQLNATDSSHFCLLRFYTEPAGGITRLTARISQSENLSSMHIPMAIRYEPGLSNRLWAAIDSDHIALTIQTFSGVQTGLYFGFLDRVSPSVDEFAYIASFLHASNFGIANPGEATLLSTCYIAKSAHTGSNWHPIGSDYLNSTLATYYSQGTSSTGPMEYPQGTFNRHTTCVLPNSGSYVSTVASNAARNAFNGNANGLNNKTVLGEVYRIEGRGISTGYAIAGELPPLLYFRGVYKDVVTGMTHLLPGAQVEDTLGRRFISVGPLRWLGMRIL